MNLVLSVTNAQPSTTYQFLFFVRDPATKQWNSTVQSYTTFPGQTQFGIVIAYPSASFVSNGRNDLVGQYVGWVSQVSPPPTGNPVAVTPNGFYFILTDATEYQRTQTVSIRASGYNPSEPATIVIRTQTTSTVVLNVTTTASSNGIVTGSWKIPRNAVLDNYVVSVTGKNTAKNPADAQGFVVRAASMTIPSLASIKTSYERTETMDFSFTAKYPDGQFANTGTALINLTSTSGNSVSLTAIYYSASQTFNATYKTFSDNSTGTWTATLTVNGYDDGFGNTGPATAITNSPQLTPATFIITVISKNYFAIAEQIKFNATIQYPDLTTLTSGNVAAFLVFSGGGHNDTMFVVYDSTINYWVGTYTPGVEPGGLWTMTVSAADSASPPNSGKATKTIQLQDRVPVSSFVVTGPAPPIFTSNVISFDGTASYDPDGVIVGWAWNFGDGSTGSGSTITHSYTVNGTYLVKLNVTDNSGSTNLSTLSVIIKDRPPVVSITQSATAATSGQEVVITITASDPDGTISSTTLDWGDGTVDVIPAASTTAIHTYSLANGVSSKTYTVTVTVHDNSGSVSSTTSNPIVVQSIQSSGNNNVSFPLYYFGILAALIALALIGAFLALRRHKVTHAKLKIDLEAVKAEAGRIENQDFFQSVKDQLKKDKEP